MTRLVALISGRGTNLQALLDRVADNTLAVELRAVVSNRPAAPGLERARVAGVETKVVDHREFISRGEFDRALSACIERYEPDLVVLAGFMRILGDEFIARYRGRLLNIHPSLLPKFRGLNTHQRAIDAGEKIHGASVHFVTAELDGGAVVAQFQVPVLNTDDVTQLAARVLEKEHILYPLVIAWYAQKRLQLRASQAFLDGQCLKSPPVFC